MGTSVQGWCHFRPSTPRQVARGASSGRHNGAQSSCHNHLPLFEAEAPSDGRPADAIARARAFGRGDLDVAGQIRQRFVAGRAASAVASPAAIAAARSAAQASGVAHMGAHALGAAAYAAKAAGLAFGDDAADVEISWQLDHMTEPVRTALRRLPLLGEDPAGPLGSGLLASGILGSIIRKLQAGLTATG